MDETPAPTAAVVDEPQPDSPDDDAEDARDEAILARHRARGDEIEREGARMRREQAQQRRSAREALAYIQQEGSAPPRPFGAITTAELHLEIKAIESEELREIRGIATTPTRDRAGDVIVPMGATFEPEIPLLVAHDATRVVGIARLGTPTPSGIEFTARIARPEQPGPLKERCDTAWAEVKSGLIRSVSVGFIGEDVSLLPDREGVRYGSCEIVELSLVAIPAQPDARITAHKAAPVALPAPAPREPSSLLERSILDYLPQQLADELSADADARRQQIAEEAPRELLADDEIKALPEGQFYSLLALEIASERAVLAARISFHAGLHVARQIIQHEVAAMQSELAALREGNKSMERRLSRHADHLRRLEDWRQGK